MFVRVSHLEALGQEFMLQSFERDKMRDGMAVEGPVWVLLVTPEQDIVGLKVASYKYTQGQCQGQVRLLSEKAA